jgi:hypothetical protein
MAKVGTKLVLNIEITTPADFFFKNVTSSIVEFFELLLLPFLFPLEVQVDDLFGYEENCDEEGDHPCC